MQKKQPRRRVQEIQIDLDNGMEVFWRPENLKEEIRKNWPEQMQKDGGFQPGRV